MTRRPSTRPRAYAPDPDAPGRSCDFPACPESGEYRAPKSRDTLNDYHWFCLEHVRAYNASWDFYKGMTPGQIEQQTRYDTAWQRPTWPLGTNGTRTFDETDLRDPLELLQTGKIKRGQKGYPPTPETRMPQAMREPVQTLGLEWPVSMEVLKARYKELAKRHHPDANGGDRAAEERLKTINLAYAAVRHYLTTEPRMAATG
ncbi:MAG: J domain-containing protein [Acetobacteraceae bacterium]|nr:J domain-containing protein [Acetobacteraceae bacterium]